jgi:sec-independent protein translocase protein TatA
MYRLRSLEDNRNGRAWEHPTTISCIVDLDSFAGVLHIMFGLGVPEVVVIFVIALLIFGPKKLPELGSALGKSLRGFQQELKGQKSLPSQGETQKDGSQ